MIMASSVAVTTILFFLSLFASLIFGAISIGFIGNYSFDLPSPDVTLCSHLIRPAEYIVQLKELYQYRSFHNQLADDKAVVPDSEYVSYTKYETNSHSWKESAGATTDKSKTNLLAGSASTSNASPSIKRQNETTLELNKKKKSKKAKQITSDEKIKQVAANATIPSSQRLMSKDDEIVVLQRLIEKNGNLSELYDLVKKSIKANISKKQLSHKVSRLKSKFQENELKIGDNNDESPTFSKYHDQKVFELSKMIWGKTSTPNNVVVAILDNKDDSKNLEDDIKIDNPLNLLFKDYVNQHGLDYDWVEESEMEQLIQRWKKFKLAESKYLLVRAKFESKIQETRLAVFNK